jgi:hypothetical protein
MLNSQLIKKMKTMNSIKRYVTISFLFSLLLMACTSDFLEYEPEGVQTDDVFYSTLDGITLGVTGTYAGVNVCPASLHNLDMMYLAFGSIASDEAEAGGERGGGDIIDFQNWDKGKPEVSEPKSVSENFYAYHYKTILRANSTLGGIRLYKENNPDTSTDSLALLNQYEGEMEFLLAFEHFKLIKVYGGIPIVDHALGSAEYGITRNTVAECLHFVQEHLELAVSLLPKRSEYPASEMGRATKGAAEALLGKAYLYESSYAENYAGDARFEGCTNQYTKAAQYLENVISSNEYELVGINGETFDTYWNQDDSPMYTETPGYRYIFTVDGENSKESVFEAQSLNDGFAYMLSRGTYLTVYTAVRNTGSGSHGWGFNCPSPMLLNAYDPEDPRKMVSIGESGDPIYISTGWDTMDCIDSPSNIMTRKFEASPEQYWSNKGADGNGPNNFPHIRYADVILMAAEAAIKTGDNAKALNYINMVRKRARNGAASGVPADLSSATFEDVVTERLFELSMEGHRFFDLVRWNKTDLMVGQPLQTYLGGVPQTPPFTNDFTQGVNEFFPLPMVEIINSNGNLVQYPGYN